MSECAVATAGLGLLFINPQAFKKKEAPRSETLSRVTILTDGRTYGRSRRMVEVRLTHEIAVSKTGVPCLRAHIILIHIIKRMNRILYVKTCTSSLYAGLFRP